MRLMSTPSQLMLKNPIEKVKEKEYEGNTNNNHKI